MGIKGAKLAWIVVSDLKKSMQFFTEKLGFKEKMFAEEFQWAELEAPEGGMTIGIAQKGYDSQIDSGDNAVITMTVEDIVKEKEELQSKGVKFLGEIIEVPGYVKLQTFVDEDGNHFQLVELLKH